MMNRQQGKRFVSIRSNRQHFQPTLHSPLEVKIRKITIHEPSSFLQTVKHGHKPQLIRTIRVDSIESTRIDNIFNPPSKSRSTTWNRVHESISGLSNRKYQRRIDSSWVYWTTLKGGAGAEEQSAVLSFLERAQEKDEAFMERMAEAERVSRQQQQTFSMDALAMLGNILKYSKAKNK